MKLKAHFAGSKSPDEFYRETTKKDIQDFTVLEKLKIILSSPNVASREPLVRAYDHEVQGATRVKPYNGKTQQGPSDAGVIDLEIHGGEEFNALAVSNGLCPQFSSFDTYLMAQRAVDEAIRNLVATGASPQKIALVDNFCWPDPLEKTSNPDAQHKMAQLVRACAGLYEAAMTFKAPLVSGKDSMKNDFIGKTKGGEVVKISVPPTLLVSAIAQVPDSRKVISSNFANAGDKIFVLGAWTKSLWGSVFAAEFECMTTDPEYPELEKNKELYNLIFTAANQGILASCHDVSDGGFLTAVTECCFGEWLGAKLELSSIPWQSLWSETSSQFVVSVSPQNEAIFRSHFGPWLTLVGEVIAESEIRILGSQFETESLAALHKIWSEGVLNVYKA